MTRFTYFGCDNRAVHRIIGDKIHLYSKRSGQYTIMVEVGGYPSLSACAKHISGAEPAPRFGCGGSDIGCVGSADGDHLIKGSLLYKCILSPMILCTALLSQPK